MQGESGPPPIPPPPGFPVQRFTYERSWIAQWGTPVGIVAVIVVVVMQGVLGGADDPFPRWFVGIWLAIVGVNLYWVLFRAAQRVHVEDQVLQWQAPLRRGEVLVSEIVAIRPSRLNSNAEVIETTGGETIAIPVMKGLTEFAAAVRALNPQIDYRPPSSIKIAERMPFLRSRFRPE